MADIIQLLPDHVANQIAAGEVVQRPASVVKELLENAIDAGSDSIKLIIKDAGKTLVQVIDNGKGMSNTDARLSFERHATSKIRSAEDLFQLDTKGFRGEALASIAAIAHVELKTKQDADDVGTALIIEGSKVVSQEVVVTPTGTSVSVKNLFFNIPARRNFLKSDTVELRHVIDEFHRVALAHPNIAFALYNNGSESFNLPISNYRQRIVNIFGNKTNEKLVPVEEDTEVLKISGFVGKPEFAKKTRGEQYFFVNNRFIKSAYLNHAIASAFEAYSFKKESSQAPKVEVDRSFNPFKEETASKARAVAYKKEPATSWESLYVGLESKGNNSKDDFTEVQFESDARTGSIFDESTQVEQTNTTYQIHNKYIVSTIKSGMLVIDQHRAHQRVLYEDFLKNLTIKEASSQQLLFPLQLHFSPQDIVIINQLKNDLEHTGFVFSSVKEEHVDITGVPVGVPESEVSIILEQLISDVENEVPDSHFSASDLLAKSMAKSLAIKTGQSLQKDEQEHLVDKLFACKEPNVSPTNRATFITMSVDELDKKFI